MENPFIDEDYPFIDEKAYELFELIITFSKMLNLKTTDNYSLAEGNGYAQFHTINIVLNNSYAIDMSVYNTTRAITYCSSCLRKKSNEKNIVCDNGLASSKLNSTPFEYNEVLKQTLKWITELS